MAVKLFEGSESLDKSVDIILIIVAMWAHADAASAAGEGHAAVEAVPTDGEQVGVGELEGNDAGALLTVAGRNDAVAERCELLANMIGDVEDGGGDVFDAQ